MTMSEWEPGRWALKVKGYTCMTWEQLQILLEFPHVAVGIEEWAVSDEGWILYVVDLPYQTYRWLSEPDEAFQYAAPPVVPISTTAQSLKRKAPPVSFSSRDVSPPPPPVPSWTLQSSYEPAGPSPSKQEEEQVTLFTTPSNASHPLPSVNVDVQEDLKTEQEEKEEDPHSSSPHSSSISLSSSVPPLVAYTQDEPLSPRLTTEEGEKAILPAHTNNPVSSPSSGALWKPPLAMNFRFHR